MTQLYKNQSESLLAVAINATDMSIQVSAGHGDRFPVATGGDFFDITLENSAGNVEIIRIGGRTSGSDVLTVMTGGRGRESTTAHTWSTSSPATLVELRLTAGMIQEVLAHASQSTAAHAATAISYAGNTTLSATTVEGALDELDNEKATPAQIATAVTDHTNAADPHPQYATDTDLSTGLSGKADSVHSHSLASGQLTGFGTAASKATGTTTGTVPLWESLPLNGALSKAAAYEVAATDRGKLIDATTGTWSLTIAAGVLSAGFAFAVRNSGTGVITINPVFANIDGAATIDLAAGESCLVVANDGATEWKTVGRTVYGSTLSSIRLAYNNSYGSTNTAIRRFVTTHLSRGADITYADSATLGASFTINTSGVYAISYTDSFSSAGDFGVSLNASELTTSIGVITEADRLVMATTGSASYRANCSVTVYLSAGDVIRPHAGASGTGTTPSNSTFTISRVA